MNSNEPSTKPKISFKRRLWVLVSVLWVIFVLVASLNFNYHRFSRFSSAGTLDVLGFFNSFVVLGIVPLIVVFGINWVAAARRHKG